tara:strand:- start:273 stop:521 length:249 start_codon:yes stop_codon:yes gene_type:complete
MNRKEVIVEAHCPDCDNEMNKGPKAEFWRCPKCNIEHFDEDIKFKTREWGDGKWKNVVVGYNRDGTPRFRTVPKYNNPRWNK